MKLLTILILFISTFVFGQTNFQKDFSEFWTDVKDNHAYLEIQGIDWDKVKEIYRPMADTIQNRDEFIKLLETIINELHNGHISLNTNLNSSNKIIPSGSDIFVQRKDNGYFITDIRKNYPSELSGLKPGLQVVKFNEEKIDSILPNFLPKFTSFYNDDMYEYALNMMFAGTHDKKRVITVLEKGVEKDYFPDEFKMSNQSLNLLEFKTIKSNTGYIKINNSLFDNDLILAFDAAIDSLHNTSRLIIDLTETPSGGNSAVARAIMGRFVEKEMPYQKHEAFETKYKIKRSWIEYVSPRESIYSKEVIIMVGHWTGSMGEGIAIGFDAIGSTKVIGTKMAGLLGAIEGFKLPQTNIGFQIPTERLYHINGTPREGYRPKHIEDNIYKTWEKVNELINVNK
ncbi:MAG TPA: peptidase [Marinilabiliales bacterium]|nr:MAG: peptidase [Bacteroidetes bacterium GWC2_40_13]OFX74659.1 MAG: peptidase [Bacteroidetes bacterium GWD2_40_43]OFX93735.1 MAG: peptidase [Bacteroidetes bacterium GWE2_40_63]OFY18520.1 MAG: peptidase [Bacteroidetes bacterium GWF2_40_13]OFZ28023.1 MAG: peptidase [Bacteroidetes bacterium RIFOXYC2_FULL_40_12]HAM99091.1 peptidase [Marinilabiliales bacterium]